MALMENGLVVPGRRPLLRLLLLGSFPLRKVLFLFSHISVHNFRDGIPTYIMRPNLTITSEIINCANHATSNNEGTTVTQVRI